MLLEFDTWINLSKIRLSSSLVVEEPLAGIMASGTGGLLYGVRELPKLKAIDGI